MAEPMTAEQIALTLIRDNAYTIRSGVEALARKNHYALEPREWEAFYLTESVVEMAYGFTTGEAREFMRITTGEV
jgi:hypothetical protein